MMQSDDYRTDAEPKAYAGGVPVFCAHDAIVSINELRPNPKNPNQHPPEQIKLLGAVIKSAGWRGPITVSTRSGMIVKGHGRLLAAQLEDLAEVPVDYQNYANEAEELADLTADNRIAELAHTDNKMLAEVFADIDTGEIPFMLSGYTEEDYGNIVAALSEAIHEKELDEPDAVVEPPAEPVTQRGDLWILGNHRVVCGDSMERPTLDALMNGGETADMAFTDPPYGYQYQSNQRTKSQKFDVLKNDDKILDFIPTMAPYVDGFVFVCASWKTLDKWLPLFAESYKMTNMIIWDKGGGGIGDLEHTFLTDYEIIMCANNGHELTGKRIGSVWSIGKDNPSQYVHATQKPVALMEQAINSTTHPGDIILDIFGGSGSTLIACEATGRKARLVELDPKYCDVIVKRYIRTTGKTDVRCVRQGKELSREEIAAIFASDDEGGEQE